MKSECLFDGVQMAGFSGLLHELKLSNFHFLPVPSSLALKSTTNFAVGFVCSHIKNTYPEVWEEAEKFYSDNRKITWATGVTAITALTLMTPKLGAVATDIALSYVTSTLFGHIIYSRTDQSIFSNGREAQI